jgi:hypothetical protein
MRQRQVAPQTLAGDAPERSLAKGPRDGVRRKACRLVMPGLPILWGRPHVWLRGSST